MQYGTLVPLLGWSPFAGAHIAWRRWQGHGAARLLVIDEPSVRGFARMADSWSGLLLW